MFLATHPRLTCLLLDILSLSLSQSTDSREKIEESKIEDIELIVLSNHCLSLRLKINDTNITSCFTITRIIEARIMEVYSKDRKNRIENVGMEK